MSLQYIIDGYNVIRHPEFPASHSAKSAPYSALLKHIKLHKLCGSPKNKVTVVLDGYPSSARDYAASAMVEVVFSQEETADERIKRMVEGSRQPRNIAVVSDDKEIRFFARAKGARILGVEEFINCRRSSPSAAGDEAAKPELTSEQISFINRELKERWLR